MYTSLEHQFISVLSHAIGFQGLHSVNSDDQAAFDRGVFLGFCELKGDRYEPTEAGMKVYKTYIA